MTERDVREALAEVLFHWNTPSDPYFVIHGRAGDVTEGDPYLPIADALLASDVVARIRAEARAEGRVVAVRHESGCSWVTNNSWCDCGLDDAWEAGIQQGRAEVVAAFAALVPQFEADYGVQSSPVARLRAAVAATEGGAE